MYKIYTTNFFVPLGYVPQFQRILDFAFGGTSNNFKRKWLMRIKLTTLIFLISLLQVSAASFGQQLTLNRKQVSYAKLFFEIRKQTGYNVLVKSTAFRTDGRIDANFHSASLEQVMRQVVSGKGLDYIIEEQTIVIREKEQSLIEKVIAYFKDIDVSGRVLDTNGDPLVGATVRLKGTDRVTTTDVNGEYMLRGVPENGKITITFVGYRIMEIGAAVEKRVVQMELINNELEEVKINAGYYSVSKRELTGSISKVGAKDIENQPVSNVLSAVQGRMAGVNIVQGGGNPGGGFDVQIRGRNSLRNILNSTVDGNQSLYILDGVPMPSASSSVNSPFSTMILPFNNISPLNSININDIESIEVLKDADATAIYGSRGANGVVLITTKKGKRGEAEVNVSSNYALAKVASKMEMMDTEQYLSMRKKAFLNDGLATYPAAAYDVNGAWDQSRHTDWQKELIGSNASTSNYSLGLNGGTEQWSYRVNAAHHQQATVYPADYKYRNNTLSTSFSHRSKDDRLGFTFSSNLSQQDNNVINEDLTNIALFLSPNAPALYNADGSLNWQNNTFTNPVASTVATYENDTKQFSNSLNISYRLFPNISFALNSGLNYQNFEEFNLRPYTRYNPSYGFTSATGSSTWTSTFSSFSYNVEPQLSADYSLGRNKLSLLLGGTFQSSESKLSYIQGSGFESVSLMMNINAARTKIFSDIISKDYRYTALFGRFNYQFDGRYILNLTARRDGSSRFGPNNRFANFGAIGAAWLFSEEALFKSFNWLSSGKIRGSYGMTGSDNIGDAQFLDTYSIASSSIYNGVVGLVPTRLFNGDFSWEKTKKLELALELGFLEDRLSFNTAWYRNTSSSQLVGIPLAATAGFTSVQANLPATVENKGFEFELHGKPISTKNFSWQSDLNLTIPRNRLLSFPNLEGSTYANQFVVGASTSIVKLYQLKGVDPGTGVYSFLDVDGDGKISSPNDNKYIEDLSVKFYGGWSNRLQYKNLDLSFLFQFSKQRNYNYHSTMSVAGTMNNQPAKLLDVWSVDHPNGFYMPYSTGANATKNAAHANFIKSSAAISDASFIRLKNVQLNYRLHLKRTPFRQVLLYVQGQNVLTFTKYFGLDPEFVVTGYLPPLKTWSFGTQINF